MLKSTYETQSCPVASTLEIVGERWTLLVVRDAFLGTRRFDDFQRSLGVARNVLQARLVRLVEAGVLERVPYQERPLRHEYRLTDKGLDLWPVVHGLMTWGNRHTEYRTPFHLEHRECGGEPDAHRLCDRCGERLSARDVRAIRA